MTNVTVLTCPTVLQDPLSPGALRKESPHLKQGPAPPNMTKSGASIADIKMEPQQQQLVQHGPSVVLQPGPNQRSNTPSSNESTSSTPNKVYTQNVRQMLLLFHTVVAVHRNKVPSQHRYTFCFFV